VSTTVLAASGGRMPSALRGDLLDALVRGPRALLELQLRALGGELARRRLLGLEVGEELARRDAAR
jgi:hypothetical protein